MVQRCRVQARGASCVQAGGSRFRLVIPPQSCCVVSVRQLLQQAYHPRSTPKVRIGFSALLQTVAEQKRNCKSELKMYKLVIMWLHHKAPKPKKMRMVYAEIFLGSP